MNAAESVKTVNLARIAVNRWAQNAVEMKNSCGVETEESGAKQERSITEWIGDQGRRLATDKVERRTNKCTSKKKTPEYWASGPQKENGINGWVAWPILLEETIFIQTDMCRQAQKENRPGKQDPRNQFRVRVATTVKKSEVDRGADPPPQSHDG